MYFANYENKNISHNETEKDRMYGKWYFLIIL